MFDYSLMEFQHDPKEVEWFGPEIKVRNRDSRGRFVSTEKRKNRRKGVIFPSSMVKMGLAMAMVPMMLRITGLDKKLNIPFKGFPFKL